MGDLTNRGTFVPRGIDRIMIGMFSAVCLGGGGYVIGPWYLEIRPGGVDAPLFALFSQGWTLFAYGFALSVVGLFLAYSAVASHTNRFYARITSVALLSGFLLRLYSLIGVMLALESWRPPSYISHAGTVVMMGAYWIWVRSDDRTTE